MAYYKNEEINRLFIFWISNHPESFHQLDMNRFYDFVLELFKEREELNSDILRRAIKTEKKWNDQTIEDFVERFIDKYFDLKRFWEYASSENKLQFVVDFL